MPPQEPTLILFGFVAALRRSEVVALDVTDLTEHSNALVIQLDRSKTNPRGNVDEIVLDRRLVPQAVNDIVHAAVLLRAGLVEPDRPQPPRRIRSYAHERGASDRAIAHQTRHRSLHSVGSYIRVDTARDDNAATILGL